jgi:hypothetical protein
MQMYLVFQIATNLYVSVNNAAFRVYVKEPKAASTAKCDLKSLYP